ncbi:MAG: cell wall anchor protein [Nonlabens sp.]|nr:cell wall anchor protein [Nonlabens sp.]
MKFYIPLLTFLLSFSVFAQVGINTVSPHPSSMLDVSSTTQGMLTPRMTTVEKNAVASPATGLLVFDTTLNSFQVYNGTAWVFLAEAKFRTNYKLVKSVADLSAELAAGGGTAYRLQTNFLYEINGVVTFDFPINLNGAYIEGVDSTEDVIRHNATGALFQGTTGGSLRNLTLSGNGRQLFNINGGPSDLLLISNSVIAGASSVGSLSGLGTVFMSVTQYVGNTTGFTITSVPNFFISNIFWTASNSGTFMQLIGTFANLQMNGGRIEVDAGETGINVASNPTISNNASLAQLSFVGGGTNYIQPYTIGSYPGFNFTKDWDVNCQGIPTERDQTSSANIYYGGTITTGYAQSIINDTPVQIKSSTNFVSSNLFRFRTEDNNNDIIYEGKKRLAVQVSVSLSVRVTGSTNDFYAFAIAKNGAIVTETNSTVNIASDAQIQNVALNGVLQLNPGDRIEVFASRLTGSGTDNLIVFSENMSVR